MHMLSAFRHGQLSPREIAAKVSEEMSLVDEAEQEIADPTAAADAAVNAKFKKLKGKL